MRRIMLLALLALALPTAALATGIDFNLTTGNFVSGTNSLPNFASPYSLTIHGTDAALTLAGITITSVCHGSSLCSFTGGTVTMTGAAVPGGSFTANIASGTFQRSGNTISTLSASLVPQAGVFSSGDLTMTDVRTTGSGRLHDGIAILDVDSVSVPEPGTLGMLGIGLIGLVGMAIGSSPNRFKSG